VEFALFENLVLSPMTTEAALYKVSQMNQYYERQELMFPLQMAVWKAQCVQIIPPDWNLINSRDEWSKWLDEGWKANKSTHRGSKEMALIVLLRPFVFLDTNDELTFAPIQSRYGSRLRSGCSLQTHDGCCTYKPEEQSQQIMGDFTKAMTKNESEDSALCHDKKK
jgi:hypothetical protein